MDVYSLEISLLCDESFELCKRNASSGEHVAVRDGLLPEVDAHDGLA